MRRPAADSDRKAWPSSAARAPCGVAALALKAGVDAALQAGNIVVRQIGSQWRADDFAVPAWADPGYQALMEELEALEQDLREHVRLEGSVLVPRLASRCVEAA